MNARAPRTVLRAIGAACACSRRRSRYSIPPHTSTAEAAPVCRSWGAAQPPNPGSMSNQLRGVAVISTCSAWAVGSIPMAATRDAALNTGTGSLEGPVQPEPGAGSRHPVRGGGHLEAERVGGRQLERRHPRPDPRPALERARVAAAAEPERRGHEQHPRGCHGLLPDQRVGGRLRRTTPLRTLVEHWNGHAWKIVHSPNAAGDNLLSGSTAPRRRTSGPSGPGLVTATLVEHWNGHAWKIVKSPNPGSVQDVLTSVSAVSPKDAWTVGYRFDGVVTRTLALHWNGKAWKVVAAPGGAAPPPSWTASR